jgi:emp24/gp25L/p24 family/GOLD
MNDVSINMHQQFDNSMNSRNHRHRNTDTGDRGTVRLREEIHEKHGTLTFISSPRDDAPVEVCIQSLSASPTTPARFSLKIEMKPYVDPAVEAAQHKAKIEGTVSSMQLDLQGMERKIDDMMNIAMWAKEHEMAVHDRSVAINHAAMYWPMIHIAVLIVAGYAQASHVARFFKKHRIV